MSLFSQHSANPNALFSGWLLPVALLVLLATALLSVTQGPMSIPVSDALSALLPFNFESDAPAHYQLVVTGIRLPRTLLCIAVGAILAMCGAVMQGLFRNPLADPGIIGVSSGSAAGAAIAIVLLGLVNWQLPEFISALAVPLFAFIGGFVTTVLVYRLGTTPNGTSVVMMLLAGIAVGALSGAGIGLLSYLANDQMLRDLSLWQMGSLAGATWSNIVLAFVTLAILLVVFMRKAQALNALLLGEAEAGHLGIQVQKLKSQLIFFTALGVGIAVSVSGLIGFVGLVVPHLIRMLLGPNHQRLIPYSALLGAALLLLADLLSRLVISPAELPVGIVTALVGAPFFIFLLLQQRQRIA
ncbi:iron chelate uptake ABC transporter family permease subunit [Agarivorans sp. B2Z047]|uniref:Hemin ABC transporter n=1 Tax=Agarivorans albus MKT 106 TaxID=1331007 RepID=R9PPF7_AGAAL|nr:MULTISPECIES: iron ABC transporter permease [Agarivorans]MPW29280.1 iron chelate uptake ABC transporter family permease subunit [Agarivorans sp. B2Z047]UQN41832.1 iron ABC transporter permease [Agarivorans sp. B2Z047]GAD03229.1 hemin ABC transporter [Agarivorans albus MKT 106]